MSLTLEEVEHIADLARLELSEDEKMRYRQQLSAVLDYFKDLQSVDTSDIDPTFSILPSTQLREDRAQIGLTLKALLRNAPEVENGQFRVPPVLDYEG